MAIAPAEAVATLGLGRIVNQIEIATRAAGRALAAQAQAQRERQAQLMRAERMLGLEPEPPSALLGHSKAIHRCLVLLLLGSMGIGRLALGSALWAIVALLAVFLFGVPHPMLVLLLGVGLAPVSLYLGARSVSRGDRSES